MTNKPAAPETFQMTAIPQAYLDTILPLIGKARDFLEHGETLAAIAFVGNFATQRMTPVLIDSRDDDAKDRSAQAVKHAAESVAADFVFMIMEAWSLQKDKLHRHAEIMERYGSIGASPYKIDIVSFSLETRHGIWMAQAPIKPKWYSKKKRTFAEVSFIYYDGAEGRFTGLLPGAGTGSGALH
jgi:hypothetical protein